MRAAVVVRNTRRIRFLLSSTWPYRALFHAVAWRLLWGAAIDSGYGSPFWITYRQAQAIGAQVRRGEHVTHIVFAKTAKKRERDETSGEEFEAIVPVRRVCAVFNANQIDGLPEKYVPEIPDLNPDARTAARHAWIDALGIDIAYGGQRAFYAPGPDRIQMPPFEAFESSQTVYSTPLHEAAHATGHRSRLDGLRGRFDDRAREELVAELGAAVLCTDLGIASALRADHASHIASWLELLADEPRAVFDAATQARTSGCVCKRPTTSRRRGAGHPQPSYS